MRFLQKTITAQKLIKLEKKQIFNNINKKQEHNFSTQFYTNNHIPS